MLIPSQAENFMNQLNEIDIAYIAGFFDGEGCVGYYDAAKSYKNRPGYFHASVHICNTDPRVISWIAKITGMGRIDKMEFKDSKRRTAYQWQIGKKADVIIFLTTIRPYLRVKAEQVDILLAHYEFEQSYQQKSGSVTPDIVKARQKVANELKRLKWMVVAEDVETGQAESLVH